MSKEIERLDYYRLYGPTKGDRIALADTGLIIEIEDDLCAKEYGDECVSGGGKCARDGMGLTPGATRAGDALDVALTNMILIDPLLGVIKGDLGIKDGKIVGVGKAGNPNTMNITPGLVVSAATEIISGGGGMIATPGGVDCHIHFQSPHQVWECLANGITTMVGGGSGAKTLSVETTVSGISLMIRAHEALPVNAGFLCRGASSLPPVIEEGLLAGAIGIKMHEDWGCTPTSIKAALDVADQYGCQVQIHTDTLNEAGNLQNTIKAINGRTIHAYHVEGAGGGHAPDILEICRFPNVITSSTNPTNPYTVNTAAEHLDMIITVHHLNPNVKEDVEFAESRVRTSTIAAEDLLLDMGAIAIMSSDSQGMGRAGETVLRTWQLASKMKQVLGPLSLESGPNDNQRVLRYLAKYTVNPAIALGIDDYVGSFKAGAMGDIVIWKKEFFGAKPEYILKEGFMVMSSVGDPNASTKASQPMLYRPQFGSYGSAPAHLSRIFVTEGALQNGLAKRITTSAHRFLPVKNTRHLTRADMVRNQACPNVEVDKKTYDVYINGAKVICPPSVSLPMTQKYYFR